MADKREIPSWNGDPKQWRRYCKEVTWYAQGTKKMERIYLAPRLRQKLTGAARLLAMSWKEDFSGPTGLLDYMKKLAKSPLARRPVPNANATLNAYFGFRRQQGEAINSFLVRELLTYEEFYEALLTLNGQKDGKALDGRLGLPKIEEPEDDDSNAWRWQ